MRQGQQDGAAKQGNGSSSRNHNPENKNPTFRLFMDARTSFPYSSGIGKGVTEAWASTPRVAAALRLLTPAEQAAVCRYFRPSDAALSLCSRLLKHLAIVRACNVSWSESEVSQERETNNGKPYFKKGAVEFNVSHHGEIVALIATTTPGLQVGIDVVQVDTARERRGLDREKGFEGWVRSFQDVFSEMEFRTLQTLAPGSYGPDSDDTLKMKLRRFYVNWALKEAYIKMTGDALMAQWLQQLEFTSTMPPPPVESSPGSDWGWGQTAITGVKLHGKTVEDARIEIDALRDDYMVATAVNNTQPLPGFEQVIISEDASSLNCLGTGQIQVYSLGLDEGKNRR